MSICTRCQQPKPQLQPIYHTRAYIPWAPPDLDESLKAESVCSDCITDVELAGMLVPIVNFVLSTAAKNGSSVELDIVRTYFTVRDNEGEQYWRKAALKAAGY